MMKRESDAAERVRPAALRVVQGQPAAVAVSSVSVAPPAEGAGVPSNEQEKQEEGGRCGWHCAWCGRRGHRSPDCPTRPASDLPVLRLVRPKAYQASGASADEIAAFRRQIQNGTYRPFARLRAAFARRRPGRA